MVLDYSKIQELIEDVQTSQAALDRLQKMAFKLSQSNSNLELGIRLKEVKKASETQSYKAPDSIIFSGESLGNINDIYARMNRAYQESADSIDIEEAEVSNELGLLILGTMKRHYQAIKTRAERELKLYLIENKEINKRGFKLSL